MRKVEFLAGWETWCFDVSPDGKSWIDGKLAVSVFRRMENLMFQCFDGWETWCFNGSMDGKLNVSMFRRMGRVGNRSAWLPRKCNWLPLSFSKGHLVLWLHCNQNQFAKMLWLFIGRNKNLWQSFSGLIPIWQNWFGQTKGKNAGLTSCKSRIALNRKS